MVKQYVRTGAHDRVVVSLGTSIVSGQLSPDDDLDVAALQERFGVSRTAAREALRVLAAKGLVGACPRRGTFVAPRTEWALLDADVLRRRFAHRVDDAFLDELGEVSLTAEPTVARLAAERRTDRDLADLDDMTPGSQSGRLASSDRCRRGHFPNGASFTSKPSSITIVTENKSREQSDDENRIGDRRTGCRGFKRIPRTSGLDDGGRARWCDRGVLRTGSPLDRAHHAPQRRTGVRNNPAGEDPNA
ncbi:GntR family transcriptional regulator [Streptosporangium sp. NPDC023825]|uniref:FadR/GntR family transcriptional regulator n=1 Tax=Streptosporangium sp. NPDC023825 TaxID=3154909 RepID=UPI003412D538